MSDLISRKEAYKAFSEYINRSFLGEVSSQAELSIGEIASVIKSIPAAFDKEKVIEELEDYLFEKYCVEGDENISEIVEKGGIE